MQILLSLWKEQQQQQNLGMIWCLIALISHEAPAQSLKSLKYTVKHEIILEAQEFSLTVHSNFGCNSNKVNNCHLMDLGKLSSDMLITMSNGCLVLGLRIMLDVQYVQT